MRMTEIKRIHRKEPQIMLIDEENKQAFYQMKKTPGGPSIVFKRHAEVEVTRISKGRYKHVLLAEGEVEQGSIHPACQGPLLAVRPDSIHPAVTGWYIELGDVVQRILGKDANALYLYCMSQQMPCGRIRYHEGSPKGEWRQQVLTEKLFGFMTVDIHVPEELYDKFAEFPPLFVHANVQEQSDFMTSVRSKLEKPVPAKNQKVVSCMKAVKICLYTPLLKWYLENGLVVTVVHNFTTAQAGRPFLKFTEWVSNERRKGDSDPCPADTAKLIGNASFGTTGMNKNNHER
jgi:hypothetical protein